jgi:hypothetical protein
MKSYFQTTLIEHKNTYFYGVLSTIKGSICIPVSSLAFIEGNCDFLDTYSVIYYKIITLYLNGVFLKCI